MYTKTSELVNEMKAHLLLRPDVLRVKEIGVVRWGNEMDLWEEKGCEIDRKLVKAFCEESPTITKDQKDAIVFSCEPLIEKYQSPGYATQYIIEAIEKLSQTKTN